MRMKRIRLYYIGKSQSSSATIYAKKYKHSSYTACIKENIFFKHCHLFHLKGARFVYYHIPLNALLSRLITYENHKCALRNTPIPLLAAYEALKWRFHATAHEVSSFKIHSIFKGSVSAQK